jgi:hypothetical protein
LVHPPAPAPGKHRKTLNDSGRSRGCDPIDEFRRLRSFGDAVLMVLVENNVVARAIHGMIA